MRMVYFGFDGRFTMTQQEFMDTLQRCLPMKDEQDMSELGQVHSRQRLSFEFLDQALVATVGAGNNEFDPESIFEETEDFSETAVVEGIRAQFVLDLENFRCQVAAH